MTLSIDAALNQVQVDIQALKANKPLPGDDFTAYYQTLMGTFDDIDVILKNIHYHSLSALDKARYDLLYQALRDALQTVNEVYLKRTMALQGEDVERLKDLSRSLKGMTDQRDVASSRLLAVAEVLNMAVLLLPFL